MKKPKQSLWRAVAARLRHWLTYHPERSYMRRRV
jgi:hypothetical protein